MVHYVLPFDQELALTKNLHRWIGASPTPHTYSPTLVKQFRAQVGRVLHALHGFMALGASYIFQASALYLNFNQLV